MDRPFFRVWLVDDNPFYYKTLNPIETPDLQISRPFSTLKEARGWCHLLGKSSIQRLSIRNNYYLHRGMALSKTKYPLDSIEDILSSRGFKYKQSICKHMTSQFDVALKYAPQDFNIAYGLCINPRTPEEILSKILEIPYKHPKILNRIRDLLQKRSQVKP